MRTRNYKPPKDVRQRKADERYIAFQQPPRVSQINKDLATPVQCGTILGGKRIFLRHKNPKTNKLGWISFIDGGTRCPNEAQRSTSHNGVTLRTCGQHAHVDHIPG